MRYSSVYKIEKWRGIRTEFHKKYTVFDGLGLVFFDTLAECRSYVRQRSMLLKKIFKESKNIYMRLSNYYFSKLSDFRISDHDNRIVNNLLRDCLEDYSYISKTYFSQYVLSKIRHIYRCLISITKILKMSFFYKRIIELFDSFFIEYPVYRSTDYVKNNKVDINKNNKSKDVKTCIA
jgi:hypothetical protein